LVLLEKVEDLSSKINLRRWERPKVPARTQADTLSAIVGNVVSILEHKRPTKPRVTQ
jgi:hypothetical protein